jgi:ABC-type transport system substrate-binding protein
MISSVWTFTLRDGVTWHDGKPFTAEDVKYTLDRVRRRPRDRRPRKQPALSKERLSA